MKPYWAVAVLVAFLAEQASFVQGAEGLTLDAHTRHLYGWHQRSPVKSWFKDLSRRWLRVRLGEESADPMSDAPCNLIPVTLFGPGNQLVSYQETLVLAKLLGCNMIVHGLMNHYAEVAQGLQAAGVGGAHNGTTQTLISFDVIFDRAHLQAQLDNVTMIHDARGPPVRSRVLSLEESIAAGWDKTANSVLDFKRKDFDKYFRRLAHVSGMLMRTGKGTRHWKLKGNAFKCTTDEVQELRQFVTKSKYIYVFIYRNMVNEFLDRGRVPPVNMDVSECARMFGQVASQIMMSPRLQESARAWTAKAFAGKDKYTSPVPFLAVHIRPYPDECLDIWMAASFNESAASSRSCSQRGLHLGMVSEVKEAMQQYGLPGDKVFIMSHPGIRHTINDFFKAEGLQPIYLDVHHVPAHILNQVDHHGIYAKVTLLSFLEQEVCRQAHVFLGMKQSSMTQFVNLLRTSAGRIDGTCMRTKVLGTAKREQLVTRQPSLT